MERELALTIRSTDAARREADIVASTEDVDSYGEIVALDWRLERYTQNPIVLWAHDKTAPIGTASGVGVRDGALRATIKFAMGGKADEVWNLVHQDVIRGVSVGFRPGRIESEVRGGRRVDVLRENELFEISVVSLPALANAGILAVRHRGERADRSALRAFEIENMNDEERSVHTEISRLEIRAVRGITRRSPTEALRTADQTAFESWTHEPEEDAQ